MDPTSPRMVDVPRISRRGRLIKLPKYLIGMKTETLTPKQEYAGSNQEYCDSINEYLHPNSDGHDPVAENNVKSHQPTKPSPPLVAEVGSEQKVKRGRGRPRSTPVVPITLKEEVIDDSANSKEEVRPRFQCIVCAAQFHLRSELMRHESEHSEGAPAPDGQRTYACSVCSKEFARRAGLADHMRIHTGARPHVCTVCGKSFLRTGHLRCHMRVHSGERPHACAQCTRTFPRGSDLRRHVDIVHAGVRAYVCSFCGKACSGLTGLVYHRRTHTGERPFVCATCGHAFAQGGALREHMRTHTGERPYACGVCARTFATSRSRALHAATHSGERPFLCVTCGRAFSRAASHREHQKTHTGARPYTCPFCGRLFAKKSTCLVHARKKHQGTVDRVTGSVSGVIDAPPSAAAAAVVDSCEVMTSSPQVFAVAPSAAGQGAAVPMAGDVVVGGTVLINVHTNEAGFTVMELAPVAAETLDVHDVYATPLTLDPPPGVVVDLDGRVIDPSLLVATDVGLDQDVFDGGAIVGDRVAINYVEVTTDAVVMPTDVPDAETTVDV